ncbi:MAG: SdrD B-like domain-containing protein, partial [bacterium]
MAALVVGFVPAVRAQTLQNVADGTANSLPMDTGEATVTLNRLASVVTDAVAEISPNQVRIRSLGNEFLYDVVPTINAGDTGPVEVQITTPAGYTNPSVSEVLVGGIPLAESCPSPGNGQYCVTLGGQVITIALGDRITASQTRIRVRFTADAPSAPGTTDFTSVLRDSSLTRSTRAGDADGDATDANSIAVEVLGSPNGLLNLALTADRDGVLVGEPILYLVEIRNLAGVDVTDVRIDDTLPPDFEYVKGSARLNGAAIADPAEARTLRFPIGTMPAHVDADGDGAADPGEPGYAALTLQAVAGAGARPGEYRSRAVATDFCDTCAISNEAEHEVDVRLDELFDLGLVIGKVFEDRDRDGVQDSDEPGVAKARVALDDGTIAITDEHGRYHIPAIVPGQRLIKLDVASLGGGVVNTTESSKILTLTPGIAARANFGVELLRDPQTIGRPAEPGVAITGEADHLPVQVLGSAETLAVLVNGEQITLPTGNVRLTAGELEEVVEVSDDGPTQPITFQLDLDFSENVARWGLQVMDRSDEVVHSVEGTGEIPGSLAWDGRTSAGRFLESGEIYHYRLEVLTREGIRWSSGNRYFGVNRRSFIAVRL